MIEEELKYLLRLLDGLDSDIYEDLMKIHDDTEHGNEVKELSNKVFNFLRENFNGNPVTSGVVLTYLQTKLQNKHNLNIIQDTYIETIENELTNANNIDKLIALISLVKIEDAYLPRFIEKVIKNIVGDRFRQHRKQVLMSLIPLQRPELLKLASELMQTPESLKQFKLTPEYMLELCYQEQTHWLLKAAQVYKHQLHDMKNVTFKINNFTKQILIMVLIDLTNSPESYHIPSLVHQLTNIYSILESYSTADDQLQYYMMEVKRALTIMKFCLENNCKIMTTSVFSQMLTQSALAVISQLCRLSKVDRYKVSRLLNSNNEILNELKNLQNNGKTNETHCINWDILTYNSYCAVTKIIDAIMACSENTSDAQRVVSALEEVKRLVLSIQPVQYSIEVIENLFSCLFLRFEYFSCEEHSQELLCGAHSDCSYFYSKKQTKSTDYMKSSCSGFICNSLTTQVIVNTLKQCLESIEEKLNDEAMNPSVMIKFKHLVKVVNHAVWKLQLVSTLSPDTSPLQLRLCFDCVDVDESSDEETEKVVDVRILRKKTRLRKKISTQKSNEEKAMITSTLSANGEGYMSASGASIDFISLMLAEPNCLVALALYHNDFTKANQIIDMFDLSDAEIATEVTFTEQLRHLVAKIKNIIYYKDVSRYPAKELSKLSVISTEVMGLVEGFLASNRAPNSFDIIELATRHPHLQLYSHQNAPFINAVDILLSSGLNREITYGLINVVERKLAEVRSCTDVAAVKKTNYIRFVEDIASVTFEIFGNNEKSFEFVHNVCGLINDCRIPIKHKEFCKLNLLSKELRKSCEDLVDIVNTKEPNEIDPSLLQKYHQIYMNVVAASDKDLCNVNEVCNQATKKARTHYLRMCYMYCKTVAQLEQEDNKSTDSASDTPYFSVLEKQLHDIFGNMINNKELPITSLEPICRKLNVNLIPKLILNFCPSISMSSPQKEATETNFNNLLQDVYNFKNTEENLFVELSTSLAPLPRAPDPQSLSYVVLNNWVLAHIVKKIHTSPDENTLQQSIDARTKFINNFMELERFNYLKVLFDNNKYLASLHTTIDLDELFIFLPRLIEAGKIVQCLHIIDALSEHQLLQSANLLNLRDLILFKMAINPRVENNWKYSEHLKSPELKLDLILNNLSNWPVEGALEALDYLRYALDPTDLEEGFFDKCKEWIIKIPLYEQISCIIGTNHWYSVYEKMMESPEQIVEILMDCQQFKLCLEWADVHDVSENMKNLIIVNLLKQMFQYTNQATPALVAELLRRLPATAAADLVHGEIAAIRNVHILQVCIDFVSEHSTDYKSFENIKIGLQIMLEIDQNLRPMFWDLIERPLLMIEQFLMNAKLDTLANILNSIQPALKRDPAGDNLYYNIKSIDSVVISANAVDALLRFYAEKALDMRNPSNSCAPPRPTDDVLLQSIDSINVESASKPFAMPAQVPPKEQWAADYSADRCMVCRDSIFSMIIRRHHCRRCGRLVCHACSRHRMQVPTYPPGVKFRVCDDCYTQTVRQPSGGRGFDPVISSSHSDSVISGVTCMDWCLSEDAAKNEAVRAEFSYEFTPNVTLCLSIMKMHSINLDYPRFLLDRADEVSREVSRGGEARLLLRARRSLLLAASELYSRMPPDKSGGGVCEAGAAHAARCLSHAAALHALVTHCAHHLVKHRPGHPSHIVRALLEAEKWELALEIATKSGLSRNSVLAAWGKACLKAGCFKQAREKFGHCFKNAPQINVCAEVTEEYEYGREASELSPSSLVNRRLHSLRQSERSTSMSSTQSDGRPRSDPPLLNEIVCMLEEINYPVNQQLLNKAETIRATNEKLATMNVGKKKIPLTEPALNIMHTLASVKKIKQGDYSDFITATVPPKKSIAQGLLRRNNNNHESKVDGHTNKLDPFFYNECVYYLSNYGSHVANIAFYMKHSNLTEVLRYCYENMVDRETFTESVYLECLKADKVTQLFKCMTDMDSTLEMWGEYITSVCRALEALGRLEALYAAQVQSGQSARAAAVCARLYAGAAPPAAPFRALLSRQHRLAAAHAHLAAAVPRVQGTESKSFHLHLDKATIEKHMTTITRQIELVKFLAAREEENRLNEKMISEVIPLPEEAKSKEVRPLTLFGSNTDRMRLVALVLVAGHTVDEGFGLAFKIITENKLDSMTIYTHVSRYLVRADRFLDVKALARAIRNSKETAASLLSDQVLEAGVSAVVRRCEARGQLHDEQAETLIEDIHSIGIKISCYLTCRILSSAYIMAARHDRSNDLRLVLAEAERLGNDHIRSACLKRLAAKSHK